MEEFDDLVPQPDENGMLDLTHRAWAHLDDVIWTMGKELLYLNVAFNNIEELPPELGDLLLLRELNVSCNQLTALPSTIGKCKRLRILKINGNHIEALPQELGYCNMLEQVIASENQLQTVPATLAKIDALRILRIQNNDLIEIPPVLGTIPTLEEIDVSNNAQLAMIPPDLRGNTELTIWVLRTMHGHNGQVGELTGANADLEDLARATEEAKLRLKDDIAKLQQEKAALLRERPDTYLRYVAKWRRMKSKVCVVM